MHRDSGGMDEDPLQDWESGGMAGRGACVGGETPCLMDRRDTSNVPPPRSYTMIWLSLPFLSRPYAIAAVVGSLMMQRTCRPTMMPASLVAWCCTLLKYAGMVTVMVMTMCVT